MEKARQSRPMTPVPSPQRPSEAAPAEEGPQTLTPPRTPADIPGLGPIRVRALQKAGYDSLQSLRDARLEDLLAVPGMSEIKARHIQAFLAQFPARPAAESRKTAPEKQAKSDTALHAFPTLTEAVIGTLGRTITLLLSAPASNFRPRLIRELDRFARQVERLAAPGAQLSADAEKRILRRLNDICGEFAKVWMREQIGRKEQAQLAATLAAVTENLGAFTEETGKTDA
ncbi:MAG TPA: helix-hairpin-helix domain-containing protein [Chthonomonadaceae bacterium]|nr:helix-hairpin-helix domain-containing protein [Chthonomonadaceae bacterium]